MKPDEILKIEKWVKENAQQVGFIDVVLVSDILAFLDNLKKPSTPETKEGA